MDGSTSKTNRELAEFAASYQRGVGLPILAQGEVARALDNLAKPARVHSRTALQTETGLFKKGYLDTYGVAHAHLEYCIARGWKRVLVVGYVPHIWRARWTYEGLGLTVIVPKDLPRISFERFSQVRLSSALRLYAFELCARVYYFVIRRHF